MAAGIEIIEHDLRDVGRARERVGEIHVGERVRAGM